MLTFLSTDLGEMGRRQIPRPIPHHSPPLSNSKSSSNLNYPAAGGSFATDIKACPRKLPSGPVRLLSHNPNDELQSVGVEEQSHRQHDPSSGLL